MGGEEWWEGRGRRGRREEERVGGVTYRLSTAGFSFFTVAAAFFPCTSKAMVRTRECHPLSREGQDCMDDPLAEHSQTRTDRVLPGILRAVV